MFQFELPAAKVVATILWLASNQVASNGKIDEELVHKVEEQLQNFLFQKLCCSLEAPKMDFPLKFNSFSLQIKIAFSYIVGPGFDPPPSAQ